MKHVKPQNGNAFFLILLGVALVAAFSMAVTRSSSVETGATSERDRIAATRIIAYGNTLRSATEQMRSNGISESDISFANNIVTGYGTVGANPSAEIFNSSGGAITYEKPDATWLDGTYSLQDGFGEWRFTGDNAVRNIGTPASAACGAMVGCKELLVILPYVKKNVCTLINNNTNYKETAGTIPVDATTFGLTKFTGTFSASDVDIAPTSSVTWGRMQGCIEGGGTPATGSYHYFQVLIAR